MKKTLMIIMAIAALSSCKKENSPSQINNTRAFDERTYDFKFKKEVKIYDNSHTSFLTILLKSDDESVVDNAYNNYSNWELELLYKQAPIESSKSSIIKENPVSEEAKFDSNSLFAEFKNPTVDGIVGYKFKNKHNNVKAVFGGNSSCTIFVDCCNYTIYVSGHNVTENCSWWTGSAWYFEGERTLYAGAPWVYGLAQYCGTHKVYLHVTAFGPFTGDLSVYY
jgi:hypothetical protein